MKKTLIIVVVVAFVLFGAVVAYAHPLNRGSVRGTGDGFVNNYSYDYDRFVDEDGDGVCDGDCINDGEPSDNFFSRMFGRNRR